MNYSYTMPPIYYSQPMAPRYPVQEYSVDTAHTLEDRSLPRDLASFPPAQLDPSHTMNVYPPFERALEYHPFPQAFPHTNGFPAGDPNIERVNSGPQSELEDIESDPEDMASDSKLEPEDHPLPADVARWISMSPAQFDREYPGGNPFVFEELNLDSEEDPESAPYVELDGARALNRISIIFYAVDWAIFPRTITAQHREMIWGVVADLLKDGRVWLWVDGDEEQCYDLHLHPNAIYWRESREYVTRKLSCSSLRLRKPRLPTWSSFRERVSKASFAMRVSVIAWATFTSVPVREAGWVRGCADWTRCALLRTARRWLYFVLDDLRVGIVNLLGDESRHSLEVAFKDNLRCHGHSCYSSPEYSEEQLLYLWSFLRSMLSGKDVSMILFVKSDAESSCQQCAKLRKVYISSKDARYIPPLSLIVLIGLRCCLAIDTPAWLRFLALGLSRGMISAAILTKMDDEIRTHLGTDEFDFLYQPWVNRLPSSLRRSVVTCLETEWREAELAVRRENQHDSVPSTSRWDSMDIRYGVRITAIYLLMSEQSFQKLTPDQYRYACDDGWIHIFNGPVYPTHIAASVESFCDASWDISTHTCCEFRWDDCPLNYRQCYAAAYLLLHPECQVVPLLEPLRRPVSCGLCDFDKDECLNCEQCRKLPEAEPLVPAQIQDASEATTIPPAGGTDDIIPTLAVVRRHSPVSIAVSQILSGSSQSHGPPLSKDVILPNLKNRFAQLLAEHNIPIQYTNLGAPQLPWCTLPQLLRNRRLEIAGWPEDLPLPDATGKHNAKGIMGLTAKDARRLHEALPGISFRRMDKARARPREAESEDHVGNPPMKKVKGKGKAPAEGEWKFRLSEVQMVIPGIRVGTAPRRIH